MMQNILSHPYLLQKVATFRDISSGSVATFRDISRHFVRFAWALRKFVFSGVAVCPAQVTQADNISVIQLADNSTPKKHSVHKTASFITAFQSDIIYAVIYSHWKLLTRGMCSSPRPRVCPKVALSQLYMTMTSPQPPPPPPQPTPQGKQQHANN